MKKINQLLVLLALSGPAVKAQQVSYSELYDDPLAYKKLFINLHFMNADFSRPNTFRVGVGAEFMLSKRLWFSLDVDKSILEQFGDNVTDAKRLDCFTAEGGVVFNFRSKVKQGKVHYHWKELGSEYKLSVKGNVLRTIGLRGGIYTYSSAKHLPLSYYNAYYSTQGVYGGIQFGAIRNKAISADGISDRHTRKSTKGVFYIDAMFSPVINYSDNTDYDGSDARSRNLPVNTQLDTLVVKNYIGARIGWMKTIRYPAPLKVGFETGLRPGLQNNFFFLVKFAVALGFISKEAKKE